MPESPKLKKSSKGAVLQPPSRIEAMGERADELEYPPCAAEYMVDWFFDAGPVLYGGMGMVPLSHAEIESWQRNTGIELTQWEVGVLRTLSWAYITMAEEAKHPSCPPPWTPVPPEGMTRKRDVAKRVKEALRS